MRTTVRGYDPFGRGPWPVGVRTETWVDAGRDRALDVEIWYPADAAPGADLDPSLRDRLEPLTVDRFTAGWAHQDAVRGVAAADGTHPLVLFAHGHSGHRCEATFLTTHLASRGFVVVAADHAGSTLADVVAPQTEDDDRRVALDRKRDVPFLIDTAVGRLPVEPGTVGVTGVSLGGWTSLIAPSVDARVRAIFPLLPAGGSTPLFADASNVFAQELDLRWQQPVAFIHGVADRDTLMPLHGQLETFRRLPRPARMVVLARADHFHCGDDIPGTHEYFFERVAQAAEASPDGQWRFGDTARSLPYKELTEEELAHDAWRGLATALFESALRGDREAGEFLEDDLESIFIGRGVEVMVIDR